MADIYFFSFQFTCATSIRFFLFFQYVVLTIHFKTFYENIILVTLSERLEYYYH